MYVCTIICVSTNKGKKKFIVITYKDITYRNWDSSALRIKSDRQIVLFHLSNSQFLLFSSSYIILSVTLFLYSLIHKYLHMFACFLFIA